MKIDYIVQPDTQLWNVLSKMLDFDPPPSRIVFVSAFASLQTLMRLKQTVLDLKNHGVGLRFVFGIDMGGTSQDLEPEGPVACRLTKKLLNQLTERDEVPTEAEALKRRRIAVRSSKTTADRGEPVFGAENIASPPPLPANLLDRLVKDVRTRRKAAKKARKNALPIDDQVCDSLLPAAFYMTLPKLQGDTIPGEGRIPLEAIQLATEFWGWREEYSMEVSPRSGKDRVYRW